MKSLILTIAAALAVPSVAAAQAEKPPQPEGIEPNVRGEGNGPHENGEHEGVHDPSKEFNWASHMFPYGKNGYSNLDSEGGPLGDDALGPEKRPIGPGEEEEPMSVPFVFVLINFGLLLILLGKKAGPIATEMAAKRSDEIKNALDEAARLRTAAKNKLDEYSDKLRAAESEIDSMIKAMRDSAEDDRKRIIAAAEAQAAAMKKDAEERIAAEIDRARHQLQREVVAAAAEVAEKVLRDKTTSADQANLVDAFLKDVNAAAQRRPS